MTEKEAGRNAAKKLQATLGGSISRRFPLSAPQKGSKMQGLKQSKASLRMQKNNKEELRGIIVQMPRHGFILNNGVNTQRRSGIVNRKKPKSTFYERKSHPFHIKANPFIEEAVENSGAVPFLAETIGAERADVVIKALKFQIENTSQKK